MRKGRGQKEFIYGVIIVLLVVYIGLLLVLLTSYMKQNEDVDYFAGNESQEEQQGNETFMDGLISLLPKDDETGENQSSEGNLSTDVIGGEYVPETTEPETYEFTVSDKTYFDDALFIGDSRTVGLREYGTLDNADYFASSGLNIYTLSGMKLDVGETEDITLEELLQQKTYGKIYLMLGINELGYDFNRTVEKYQELVGKLRKMQEDAILYVCANLHVNSVRNAVDEIHNNEAINRMNQVIAEMADQKDIFYLDVNPMFDDENGNLSDEYTSDDSHVTGAYYAVWCDWYCENTIVKQ